ncbi:hypothetical protein BGZ67_007666 [Mortierella alpina]|nr:hypothetical protein BGZ67_007666 [Mortierella alpina]
MLGSIRIVFGIAAVTLCLIGVVFCVPEEGNTPAIQTREVAPFGTLRGREPAIVLEELAKNMQPQASLPWETYFTSIDTAGASDIQVFNRSDLNTVVGGWGLQESEVSTVVASYEELIERAIVKGVHDVQGHYYTYTKHADTSLNMTSLISSIRVRQTGEDYHWMVELGHIIMITEATPSTNVRPEYADAPEMEAVLNQAHADWALKHIPVATVSLPSEPAEVLERRVMTDPRFEMIMQSVQLFAETWEKVAQAFASNVTQSVKRKVCLGFDSVAYHAESFVMQDVPEKKVVEALTRIIKSNDLPPAANKNNILFGVQYSDKFTWIGDDMIYKDRQGNQSFLYLAKHGNLVHSGKGKNRKTTKTVDIIYSRVKSNYLLAQDMLVVREQKSILGGIWSSDKTYINYVPHTLTPSDVEILDMFWKMIAYKQMAMATRVRIPKMPNLKGLCDRSME